MKYVLIVDDTVVSENPTLEIAKGQAEEEYDLHDDNVEIHEVINIYVPKTKKTKWVIKENEE